MCERKAETEEKNLRFHEMISEYVWIKPPVSRHKSDTDSVTEKMAVKKTTTTKPHWLYYYEFFLPGLLCLSLKNILLNGLKILKCFHTKKLVKRCNVDVRLF